MTDNVTDLDQYRRRASRLTVGRDADSVLIKMGGGSLSLTPEEARHLGEELIDSANLVEDLEE